MNFLPPGLREIQTGKLICRPIRVVVKVPPRAGIHQGKLDLPRDVGTVNRPIATLHLAVNRADHAKRNPRDDEHQTESSFVVHGTHPSSRLRETQKISACFSEISLSRVKFWNPCLRAFSMNSGVIPCTLAPITSSQLRFLNPADWSVFTYSAVTPCTFIPTISSTSGLIPVARSSLTYSGVTPCTFVSTISSAPGCSPNSRNSCTY